MAALTVAANIAPAVGAACAVILPVLNGGKALRQLA
jgi:hypothetical protein